MCQMLIPPCALQAGASAVDALRSIVVSEQLLGTTEVAVIKHTGCGMLTFKNEDAYGIVEKNLGLVASFFSVPVYRPFIDF